MNRIEEQIKEFRKYEARMEKLFPGSIAGNRAFQRERLAAMEKILRSPGNNLSAEEKMALRVLRYERKGLERRLFPSRLVRLARRVLVPLSSAIRKTLQQARENGEVRNVKKDMQELGQITQGSFSKEKEKYVSAVQRLDLAAGQRFEYQLVAALDAAGKGRLEGLRATLIQPGGATIKNYFAASDSQLPSHREMIALLKGESIRRDGPSGRANFKLDFNDRDANGSFRLKEAVVEPILQSPTISKGAQVVKSHKPQLNGKRKLGI